MVIPKSETTANANQLKAKRAAFRRAAIYLTPEYRRTANRLQREVCRRNLPSTASDPITVSNDKISSLIKGIKPRKSPGADGILANPSP
ncbi:unnamed protein product [Parnassius mnemosyne]|uniref:Uncharacterized protein n=1 Tax=Parnassius mnemosyne TaxID=213953 RepID=A0AAV1LQ75_9NEOP